MGKIESNFSYSFQGKVWNIVAAEDGEHLLLEVRDDEAFQATYFLLDLESLEFKMTNVSFDEPWWIGIGHVSKELILFFIYENQDNPDKKIYFVYDVHQSSILWEREGLAIVSVNNNLAHNLDVATQEYNYLDLKSGENITPTQVTPTSENKKLKHSFHYPEGSDYFKTVSQFLASLLTVTIVGGVDYFQYDNHTVVISYYQKLQKGLLNRLIIVDKNKEIIFQETLGEGLSGISDDTFFIYNDNLIFVKEKHHFFIYSLTDQ